MEDKLSNFSDEEVRRIANHLLSEIDGIAAELGVEVPTGGNCILKIKELKSKLRKEDRCKYCNALESIMTDCAYQGHWQCTNSKNDKTDLCCYCRRDINCYR